MNYELLDYQRDAALQVLRTLSKARREWHEDRNLSAFALSAVTGAGKTVIATAVIEALLHGSADLDTRADPRAAFLWVTDDPALNRQTRNKMIAGSDLLPPSRLAVLDNDYLDDELHAGSVYFLNIYQLSKSSGFARGGRNLRQHSGWEIIGNTIKNERTDLYVVLDEAHRGMTQSAERPTVVHRILGGQASSNPPAPMVWGISATIERFTKAMAADATRRTTFPAVVVPIDKVRESGIIKDRIELDEPSDTGVVSATLLRAAVEATLDYEERWSKYSIEEDEPEVVPALVIQVADMTSEAGLLETISIIEQQWPGLGPHAIVNVFGEHDDLTIGDRKVRWVAPESIQDETSIRIVLAKTAISTGWDCPRAEVLYSERPANDATHIAQVIGRMVRSPLARRISTDDALNSVSCFLPGFKRSALQKVADELTKPGEAGSASDVVVSAALFERNQRIPAEAFTLVESLPSLPKPDPLASPLRRAKSLVKLLTDDNRGTALFANAGADLTQRLNLRFDGLAAEHAEVVRQNVEDLASARIDTTTISHVGDVLGTASRTTARVARDIDRYTRAVVSSMREGVARDYVRYRLENAGDGADVLATRTEVAALVLVDGVREVIDDVATEWVSTQLTDFAVEIKNATGAMKDAFMRVKEQTSRQEETGVELPTTLKAATKTSNRQDAEDLPRFPGHLFADAEGEFPTRVNEWERTVLRTEAERPSFVAWYRNPSRAGVSSLRIGYQTDSDQWASLQVDFLVVSRTDTGALAASIVDPHGDHLADARAKLRALASYAERFGDRFVRIESITKTAKGLRVLDLLDPKCRRAVKEFEGGKVTYLYESDLAIDYR